MSFNYQKSQAYFKGEFIPFAEATVSIASSSVLYGLTIYTVFNVSYNKDTKKLYIFRLEDHFKRLINSAKIMDFHQFAENFTYKEFESIIVELIQKNNIKEDVLVRAAVYIDELIAGTKIHGLKNSFSAYVYPVGQILPKDGVHAQVSSWQRTPDNSMPSRAKINGSYINASLMKNEAIVNGYDEAIALDQHGHVTEGTVANLFIVRGNTLITPDESTDLLEGITRATVLQLAKDSGIQIQTRTVDRSELYIADEVFMCGSSAKITPVLSIDRRPVNNQTIGTITTQLSEQYNNLIHNYQTDQYGWLREVDTK